MRSSISGATNRPQAYLSRDQHGQLRAVIGGQLAELNVLGRF